MPPQNSLHLYIETELGHLIARVVLRGTSTIKILKNMNTEEPVTGGSNEQRKMQTEMQQSVAMQIEIIRRMQV